MSSHPKRVLTITAALFAALALLAGCGGGADDSTDPQELLTETFSGDGQVESGVLDISVDAAAEGDGGGSLTASLSGPFESTDPEKLPLIDVDASVDLEAGPDSQSIEGGVTVVEDGAYVTTGGQAYQVDQATYDSLVQAFAQSAQQQDSSTEQGSAIFDQLGIDPSTWITDVTNEGTEDVDGTETIHISGTPDVSRILEDAQRLDPTGSAAGAGSASQLADSVQSSSVDVYTGADDKILRKLDLAIELADPGGSGQTVTFSLSIGISAVNEDQTIEAPADAKPLDDLIPGGLGALGGLQSGGTGLGDLGGSPEYQQCVATASDPDELAQCAKLL
jgi:hypothetical protein